MTDPPPPPDVLRCDGLRKRYGRTVAVDDVSFAVHAGEIVGLLGPNGAGKTSVIKMLLGLTRPDAGTVRLFGLPPRDRSARRRVGYLPELFRYQPWLTAREVIDLHVRLAEVDVPTPDRRAGLELVGLGGRNDDRVGGFSKGMQQRLGLAVALVARPDLVILDEPTSALDPLGRADVREIVLGLRARGVTVILNSHLIGEVERVCDRVVILDRGRVAASGTLGDLLGRRSLELRLGPLTPAAHVAISRYGTVERDGPRHRVTIHADRLDHAPDRGTDDMLDETAAAIVRDLVRLGVDVHEIGTVRATLEDRLLAILRTDRQEVA
jgi:ABC-2 type transport system ATP-binding protein